MPRRLVLIAATFAIAACAKTEPRVENPPKPVTRRPSTEVVGGFVADSAANQANAAVGDAVAVNDEPVEVLDLQDDTTSDALALVATNIDTTVKLGAWLKSHPADRVGTVAPVGKANDEQFCRTAVVRTKAAGVGLVRSALFYLPAPPKGESLPTDTVNVGQDQCQLGAVVLASEEIGVASAQALRDSLANAIDRRLGSRSDKVPELAGGVRGADSAVIWRAGTTSVVVTVSENERFTPAGAKADSSRPRVGKVFVVAYTPGSDAADFDSWEARYEERHRMTSDDRRIGYSDVDSALAWAALPAVTGNMKTVMSYLIARDEDTPRDIKPRQVDLALVRAMKAIHDAAPSLSPARRAAALFAGDILFSATYGLSSADTGHTIMNALPAIGISLDEQGEDGRYYTHTWLWDAYRADSTGRTGRLAVVRLLSMRWPENSSCDAEAYKRIIEHGEAALARGNNNPLIHYYLGSAYKTIYDLAHWESGEYGNPSAYKAEAEPARLKAIEHYRIALQSLPDRATRKEAWLKAMRLLLRRSGEQPEYVCLDD